MKTWDPSRRKRWDDIPHELRVDFAFLRECGGAHGPNGDQWVRRQVDRLVHPRCQQAVRWLGSDRYAPCSIGPRPGQEFCFAHGGDVNPDRGGDQQELHRQRRLATRLGKQLTALTEEHDRLVVLLAQVVQHIAALEAHAGPQRHWVALADPERLTHDIPVHDVRDMITHVPGYPENVLLFGARSALEQGLPASGLYVISPDLTHAAHYTVSKEIP